MNGSSLKDYLTNRRQYVTANGLNSDINSIKCAVPWLDTLRPPCKIFLAATGFYVQFKYTLFGYNVVAICLQA